MKVLIMEDQPALRKILQDKLQLAGFETLTAKDGEEGWEMAKANKPDAILFNLILPKLSAFDVLRMLKQDSMLKDVPVFVLADLGEDESLRRISQMGITAAFVAAEHPLGEIVEKVKKELDL